MAFLTIPVIDGKQIQSALGFDPGRENTGWAHYCRGLGLTHSGVLDGLDCVDFIPWIRKQALELFKSFKPDCVAIERFHSQPRRASKRNFELINLTIGTMIGICYEFKVPFKLITAATHKRWIARQFVVGQRAARGRGRIKRRFDIRTYEEWKILETEHEADAANLAKYALEKAFNH
jgi:Holliday junction resolvasome RuvABC endonuclease subunit